jgi:hypothetical protein
MARFEVHLYECDSEANVIEESGVHFDTDDMKEAFARAAMFYRKAENPQVNIFDNESGDYVAEWDGFSADY